MWANRGFSYIEILIVVALATLFLTATMLTVNNYQGQNKVQTYRTDFEKIETLISKAHSYGRANRLNDHWGIKQVMGETTLCGTTAVANCFILFKGNDFGTRDSTYDEKVTFSTDLSRYEDTNNEDEIYFEKVTGWGKGFLNASSSDATLFRLRSADNLWDCEIRVGIMGVVYDTCENTTLSAAGQTCGNGIIEGTEVCDSTRFTQCTNAPGFFSDNFVYDDNYCAAEMFACNAYCSACKDEFECS